MEVVKAKKLYEKAEDDKAANYFMEVLLEVAGEAGGERGAEWPAVGGQGT